MEISNHISRAVDFSIDSVLKGYVSEFSIEYTQSYSVAEREREFFYGPRDKYLRELMVWIKMALHDCGTLPMRNWRSKSIACWGKGR